MGVLLLNKDPLYVKQCDSEILKMGECTFDLNLNISKLLPINRQAFDHVSFKKSLIAIKIILKV